MLVFGRWKRSCDTGNCVEVMADEDRIKVRDKFGNICYYDADEWFTFVEGVKVGQFDLPSGS